MNEHFSIRRFLPLLRMDILARYRPVAITTAVFAALILVSSTITVVMGVPGANVMDFWFIVMLFGWGAVESSLSFRELHDKSRNAAFLLIPASALEKTASRLLFVTVLLGAYILAFATVMMVLNNALVSALTGADASAFHFFDRWPLAAIGFFVVNQSLYFFGAAWFRRWHFIKMALVLNIFPMLLSWLSVGAFLLFFGNIVPPAGEFGNELFIRHVGLIFFLWTFLKVFFFGVIPVFCWIVAWLRVRETQVAYGI